MKFNNVVNGILTGEGDTKRAMFQVSYLFVFVLGLGLNGFWLEILCGNIMAKAITFLWGLSVTNCLKLQFDSKLKEAKSI